MHHGESELHQGQHCKDFVDSRSAERTEFGAATQPLIFAQSQSAFVRDIDRYGFNTSENTSKVVLIHRSKCTGILSVTSTCFVDEGLPIDVYTDIANSRMMLGNGGSRDHPWMACEL